MDPAPSTAGDGYWSGTPNAFESIPLSPSSSSSSLGSPSTDDHWRSSAEFEIKELFSSNSRFLPSVGALKNKVDVLSFHKKCLQPVGYQYACHMLFRQVKNSALDESSTGGKRSDDRNNNNKTQRNYTNIPTTPNDVELFFLVASAYTSLRSIRLWWQNPPTSTVSVGSTPEYVADLAPLKADPNCIFFYFSPEDEPYLCDFNAAQKRALVTLQRQLNCSEVASLQFSEILLDLIQTTTGRMSPVADCWRMMLDPVLFDDAFDSVDIPPETTTTEPSVPADTPTSTAPPSSPNTNNDVSVPQNPKRSTTPPSNSDVKKHRTGPDSAPTSKSTAPAGTFLHLSSSAHQAVRDLFSKGIDAMEDEFQRVDREMVTLRTKNEDLQSARILMEKNYNLLTDENHQLKEDLQKKDQQLQEALRKLKERDDEINQLKAQLLLLSPVAKGSAGDNSPDRNVSNILGSPVAMPSPSKKVVVELLDD